MGKLPLLSPRLSAIASLVTPGARLGDIGTDHAYLPAYLAGKGIIPFAVAADIAKGPLARAEKTVREAGLERRISLVLTDGLSGLEKEGLSELVIAGMGGELIIHILSQADFIKTDRLRLILQPMTRADVLRRWLAENGFETETEALCEEDRIYQILVCRYDGMQRKISDLEALIGVGSLSRTEPIFKKQFARLIEVYSARIGGKQKAGLDASEEEALVKVLKEAL